MADQDLWDNDMVLSTGNSIPIMNLTNITDPGSVPSGFVFNSHSPTLLFLVRLSSSLSIIGAGFIILSFVLFKESRKFSRKLLVFLTIADIFSAATWLWSTHITTQLALPSTQCIVQGFMLQFFYLASYVWTSCFAFHIFQLIWKKNTTKQYEKVYHLLGWGVPLVIDLYFLIRQLLGQPSMGNTERPWCWISSKTSTTAWSLAGSLEQLIFFYFPLILLFGYNLGVYAFLITRVRQVLTPEMQKKVGKRLTGYLVVFFLCSVWGLFNRVWQIAAPSHEPPKFLEALEAVFSPLQGFANACVYGLNDQLRKRYTEWLCPRCKKDRSLETPVFANGDYRSDGELDSEMESQYTYLGEKQPEESYLR